TRTKAAADGGWVRLPFRPAVKRHFRFAPYAEGGRNEQFYHPMIDNICLNRKATTSHPRTPAPPGAQKPVSFLFPFLRNFLYTNDIA
ncbi:MAG: hypothetical protein LUF28_02500, partial [Clostridiales bacterium]|nr:hypothetical protein [Clostridiales bacterium]